MAKPFIGTTRERLFQKFKERLARESANFTVRTIPYFSKRTVEFDVVTLDDSSTNGLAFLKCLKQEIPFFDYGVGQRIHMGANQSHRATSADTNLAKAKSTNGAADMCVEAVALQPVGARIKYASGWSLGTTWNTTDSDVLNAIAGNGSIYDPAAIALPPQVHAPVNLEQALWSAIIPESSVKLEFDFSGFRPLGNLCQFGQARGSSYKNAFGEPDGSAALEIEEGYTWAADGNPDSDLALVLEVHNPVVVPINLVTTPDPGSATYGLPEKIWLEVIATLRGFEISGTSQNQ